MTPNTINLELLDYITEDAKLTIFLDLFERQNFSLASAIFKKLDLTQERIATEVLSQTHASLLDDNCDSHLKKQIQAFNLKHINKCIDNNLTHNDIVIIDLFIQKETVHEFFALGQKFSPRLQMTWEDAVLREMDKTTFIDFTHHNRDILEHFHDLDFNFQIKLLSQSNAWEYMSLPEDYFKEHSYNSNYNGSYLSDVDNYGEEYIESISSKVVVILNALDHVKQPKFKEFLSYFQLDILEKELMMNALLQSSLLAMNQDNMDVFLKHYDLKISALLNKQISKSYQYEDDSLPLFFILHNQKAIESYEPILRDEKKLALFSKSEFLFHNFNDLDTLFHLGYKSKNEGQIENYHHLVQFLKLTTLAKKDMTEVDVIKAFHRKLSGERKKDFYEYELHEESFTRYLTLLEKITMEYSLSSEQLDEQKEKPSSLTQEKGLTQKKLKI